MDDLTYVYAIGFIAAALLAFEVLTKRFDPFAPIWLFLVGYLHIYVLSALTLREWALGVRGLEIVTAANFRAFWGLLWFVTAYYSVPAKLFARCLPAPPRAWSMPAVSLLTPVLIAAGFTCTILMMKINYSDFGPVSQEMALVVSFPFLMIVGGIILVVTGRNPSAPKPLVLAAGFATALVYVTLWMFNGKRSPSLIGALSTICAFYITRGKRPSWPVLITTAFVGALIVSVAITWRFNRGHYDRTASGFIQFITEFDVSQILNALGAKEDEDIDPSKFISHESLEYGGFLLMLDTVPERADYDYGANYLRCFSTFIPRIVWPDKPLYGRAKWIAAWVAGSELKRDDEFAGPSIGILGATQLNGGALGTLIVLGIVAATFRVWYEYFRSYEHVPWVQVWWALTYYNAWFSVVADDPTNWFYYNYGFTCMPVLVGLWVVNALSPAPAQEPALA
jgi:hypothetical protein